jgi:predicted dehydrogenase
MRAYAAQVDRMDQGIARIVRALRDRNVLDDTLLLFVSDNGASDEELPKAQFEKRLPRQLPRPAGTSPGTSGNGAPTGSPRRTTRTRPATTRRGPRPEASASCAAARISATTRTATASLHGRRTHPNPPPATSASGARSIALRTPKSPLDFLIPQCKRSRVLGVSTGVAQLGEGRSEATAPLRIGVVGLGAVAQAVHLPLLAKHPALFRPAALCDLSPSTRARLAGPLALEDDRLFSSAEELVAFADIDAVAILTSGSHGELAAAAARADLAIFCEKPLAYTRAEIDELATLDPRLMLGYMKLYDPAVERARELLAGRPAPRAVDVTVLHPPDAPQLAHAALPPRPTDLDAAMLDALSVADAATLERALGAVPAEIAHLYSGAILGSIVHELAVIRYLVGGPLAVESADAWEHSVALDGRLPGGARVSIRWHYLERYPAYREEVRVHDEAGTVALTFPAPYLLHAPTVLTVVDGDGAGERRSESRWTAEAFERQWLAFADFVRGGAAPRAGIHEGREDVVACQAATVLLAARKGITVGGEAAGGGT